MPPVKELTPTILKDMTDRQVLNENLRLHQVFSNYLENRVKDGIFFEAPEGSVISEEAATILVKPESIIELSGKKLIAVSSDGFAYGIIKLGKPKPIDVDKFNDQISSHGITEVDRKKLWPDAETLYIYSILDFGKFADPLKVKLPQDHSDIIKDIEFENPNALDEVIVDGLSSKDITDAYFLVVTEMDLRELKRTTNDALDKALARSLRKTIQKQGGTDQIQLSEKSFLVVQPKGKSFPFVLQHHARGIWSKSERTDLRNELKDIQKLPITDRKKALKKILSKFDAEYLIGSASDIQTAIKNGKSVDSIASQFLKKESPSDKADISRIVNRGSFHSDLRMKTPKGSLIGWTINSPTSVIQKLDGTLIIISPDKFLDYKEGENILARKKSPHVLKWLNMVTSGNPTKEISPGEEGATEETYGLVIYEDSGSLVYGVQKSGFHEYFLWFDKNKKLNGRWGFQLHPGGEGRSPAWLLNKPKEQRPFIQTHKKEGQAVWNENAIPTLRGKGYKPLDPSKEVEKKATIIPILKRDDEERTVWGVVLEPEVVDVQNEIYSAEVIKDTAYNFNEEINGKSMIGVMHSDLGRPFTILESYIAPVEFKFEKKTVKKGSWLMKVRVNDDEIWTAVKSQILTGFSIHGLAIAVKEPDRKAA